VIFRSSRVAFPIFGTRATWPQHQWPNVGTGEAYNASKWLCEFNCVMPTITPGVNDSPNGPLRQQSCPMLKHFFPLGFSQGLTQNESSGIRRSFLRKRESR